MSTVCRERTSCTSSSRGERKTLASSLTTNPPASPWPGLSRKRLLDRNAFGEYTSCAGGCVRVFPRFVERNVTNGRRFLAAVMALALSVCAVGSPVVTSSPLKCGRRCHVDHCRANCPCRQLAQQKRAADEHSCCQKKEAAASVCQCWRNQPEPVNVPTRGASRLDHDWAVKAFDGAEIQIADSAYAGGRRHSLLGSSRESLPRWQSVACSWLL